MPSTSTPRSGAGVAVVAGGIAAGPLVAGTGSVTARRSVTCMWPAVGQTMVAVTFIVALLIWLDSAPCNAALIGSTRH